MSWMRRWRPPAPRRLRTGWARWMVPAIGVVPLGIAVATAWAAVAALPDPTIEVFFPGRYGHRLELGSIPSVAAVVTGTVLALAAAGWVVGCMVWFAVPRWFVAGVPIILTLAWSSAFVVWCIVDTPDDGARIAGAVLSLVLLVLLAGALSHTVWRNILGHDRR